MSLGATESADAGHASAALVEPLLTTQDLDPEACEDGQDTAEDVPAEAASDGSTLSSTVATLCIGVLGSGQLALPYAVHLLGLAGGMLALGVMGVVAVVTLYMLAECREVARSRCYGGILQHMLGPRCSHVANGLLALYAWGGGVTYLMILGKELQAVVSKLTFGAAQSLGPNIFMMAAVALCILPLSCFRTLDRLKFTSTLGAAAAVYITLVVSANALSGAMSGGPVSPCQAASSNCSSSDECEPSGALFGGHSGGPAPYMHMWPSLVASPSTANNSSPAPFRLWPDLEGLSPFHILFNVITALAIFGFALNSAWCFVPIISNLRDRTAAKSSAVIVSSQTIILLNYVLISVSGYFSFCDTTHDDILQNLDNSVAVVIARAMLVAQLSFALPLRFSVTRGIISKYVFGEQDGRSSCHPESSLPAHLLVTAAIVCSAALVASFAGSISLAMSLASTVCASAISYVFPALCYLQLLDARRKEQPQQQQQQGALQHLRFAFTCAILTYGLFMMFIGTGMNVYGAMKGFVVIGG